LILFAIILYLLYYFCSPHFFYKKTDYKHIIKDCARRHCVDPALIKAVIWQESRFSPNAKGRKGEVGLMQIRPKYGAATDWARAHGVEVPSIGLLYRPELNIEIGTWYLGKALKNWHGYKYQYQLALSEYNAGRAGMKEWVPDKFDGEVVENIKIPSTKAYVKAIMKRYEWYAARRRVE
jgi:soluble lytic murein transglycosylase